MWGAEDLFEWTMGKWRDAGYVRCRSLWAFRASCISEHPESFIHWVSLERNGERTTTWFKWPGWGPFMMYLCLLCVCLDSSAFWIWRTAQETAHFLLSATSSALPNNILRQRLGAFLIDAAWFFFAVVCADSCLSFSREGAVLYLVVSCFAKESSSCSKGHGQRMRYGNLGNGCIFAEDHVWRGPVHCIYCLLHSFRSCF